MQISENIESRLKMDLKNNLHRLELSGGNYFVPYSEDIDVEYLIIERHLDGNTDIRNEILKNVKGEWMFKNGSLSKETKIYYHKIDKQYKILVYNDYINNIDFRESKANNEFVVNNYGEYNIRFKQPHHFIHINYLTKLSNEFIVTLQSDSLSSISNGSEVLIHEVEDVALVIKNLQFKTILSYCLTRIANSKLSLPKIEVEIRKVLLHFVDSSPLVMYSSIVKMISIIVKQDSYFIDELIKGEKLFSSFRLENCDFKYVKMGVLHKVCH